MKSTSQLQTISDVKGMRSAGARSIPKTMRSSYLELYVLDRERARLEKEKSGLDKRRNCVQTRFNSIARRMENLKKEIGKETDVDAQGGATSRKSPKKFKMMSMGY